jgi:hypothetical protein
MVLTFCIYGESAIIIQTCEVFKTSQVFSSLAYRLFVAFKDSGAAMFFDF